MDVCRSDGLSERDENEISALVARKKINNIKNDLCKKLVCTSGTPKDITHALMELYILSTRTSMLVNSQFTITALL